MLSLMQHSLCRGGTLGQGRGRRPIRYTSRTSSTRASYAVEDLEGGRRHPEQPHPYRSEFQRDRDRILHSKAFRRLENKTQVFAPGFSDHFRTRLTHTLEVTQVARTIGQALGLNTDLCEVLALGHDIGHPPFGHEGEKVLNDEMRQVESGFDHNLHALRIVEDFEEKYPHFRGLNLTHEVREGIVKHSNDWEQAEKVYIDLTEYNPGIKPSLEAQVIDFADEIAYNTADLDDGYRAGLLSLEQMLESSELFQLFYASVDREVHSVQERLKISEVLRRILDFLVTDLIGFTASRIEKEGPQTVQDIRLYSERLLGFSPKASKLNRQLKNFLNTDLYNHRSLDDARRSARKHIQGLFSFYHQQPNALPDRYYSRIDLSGVDRVICDYIAGMTDSFAQMKYKSIVTS